jgi:hypothetical protein
MTESWTPTHGARQAPVLPGADVLAFTGIDSMQKRVYGHKKQGAKFGHTKIQGKSLLVRGLNVLAAVVSTARRNLVLIFSISAGEGIDLPRCWVMNAITWPLDCRIGT